MKRHESVRIILHGQSELEASNVVLTGAHTFEVSFLDPSCKCQQSINVKSHAMFRKTLSYSACWLSQIGCPALSKHPRDCRFMWIHSVKEQQIMQSVCCRRPLDSFVHICSQGAIIEGYDLYGRAVYSKSSCTALEIDRWSHLISKKLWEAFRTVLWVWHISDTCMDNVSLTH